jgi:hypothetical protein
MSPTFLLLDLALIGLLAATLFHAVRLERALGVLKRDRATLEGLVGGFNAATRQAEAGIDRLRGAVDGAGRQVARQIDTATTLKDDLAFLTARGEQLADRLDLLVRQSRAEAEPSTPAWLASDPAPVARPPRSLEAAEAAPRLRSQAERDLMRALRMAR